MPKSNAQTAATQNNSNVVEPNSDVTPNSNAPDNSGSNGEETETVVTFQPRGKNRFAVLAAADAENNRNKAQSIAEAKAKLHDTSILASKQGTAANAVLEPANAAALMLYNGLTRNIFSPEEVSDMIGAEFGYKLKKDNTASKTPKGYGEEIRKRVQRLWKAYDYAVNGNEPVAFYEPLEREDVQAFLNEVKAGKRTPFAFYQAIGEFKSKAMGNRPKLFADPRRIAGLTRDILGNVGSTVQTVLQTPGLEAAYLGLWRALSIIGQELPDEESEQQGGDNGDTGNGETGGNTGDETSIAAE